MIIATSAGGSWSPTAVGTTAILWIGKRVSSGGLLKYLILPSIICFALPYFIASFLPIFKGNIAIKTGHESQDIKLLSSKKMLSVGLIGIIFVPIFKTLTHLPPYMGMVLSLGFVWLISEFIHPEENFSQERTHLYSVHKA